MAAALPPRPDPRALAVLVFGACVIGFAPILVRLSDAGPAATGAWRMAFAMPMLAVMAWRSDGAPMAAPSRLALAAGLFFALDLAAWHYGVAYTSVANATVLSNLTPVIVTAVAWLAFKQRPRGVFVAGAAVALAGAWTMAAAKGGGGRGTNPPLGDALSVLTALWYSLYFLAIGAARRTETASRVMLGSTFVALPLLVLVAIVLGERLTPVTLGGWLACLGLGLVHVTGQGAIAWALGRLPPAVASVTVLVQPVVAALVGWLLFQEGLTPLQALGGAGVLAGVVIAQRAARRPPQSGLAQ